LTRIAPQFLFDFGSPNAYLSHLAIPAIEQRIGVKFEYVPILLGGIFKSTNNKSPAETLAGVKNKREFQQVETERFIKRFKVQPYVWNPHFPVNTLNLMRTAIAAQLEGVFEKYVKVQPYVWNPHFPVNTLNLMRTAIAAQLEGVFEKYVEAAFHHMWREPKKMDDPEVAAQALASSGLDAQKLFTRAQEPEVKARLIKNTEEAVARGAFGSPTFFVGNEMFFGKEQLREVEETVLGT